MPQRKSVRRFPSVEIQGEDSWVEVSRLTVGEAREADRVRKSKDTDSFDAVVALYERHIRAWNWVDDDGGPLPLPGEDPDVVNRLTDMEFSFLGDCIAGNEQDQKN